MNTHCTRGENHGPAMHFPCCCLVAVSRLLGSVVVACGHVWCCMAGGWSCASGLLAGLLLMDRAGAPARGCLLPGWVYVFLCKCCHGTGQAASAGCAICGCVPGANVVMFATWFGALPSAVGDAGCCQLGLMFGGPSGTHTLVSGCTRQHRLVVVSYHV